MAIGPGWLLRQAGSGVTPADGPADSCPPVGPGATRRPTRKQATTPERTSPTGGSRHPRQNRTGPSVSWHEGNGGPRAGRGTSDLASEESGEPVAGTATSGPAPAPSEVPSPRDGSGPRRLAPAPPVLHPGRRAGGRPDPGSAGRPGGPGLPPRRPGPGAKGARRAVPVAGLAAPVERVGDPVGTAPGGRCSPAAIARPGTRRARPAAAGPVPEPASAAAAGTATGGSMAAAAGTAACSAAAVAALVTAAAARGPSRRVGIRSARPGRGWRPARQHAGPAQRAGVRRHPDRAAVDLALNRGPTSRLSGGPGRRPAR